MPRRPGDPALALAAVGIVLLATGCTGGDDKDTSTTPSASSSTSSAVSTGDSSTCGYLYEWVDTFRFPLQPDPHAAYTYVVPKITDGSVGFEISGSFPYASWTEWMVYTGLADGAQPVRPGHPGPLRQA